MINVIIKHVYISMRRSQQASLFLLFDYIFITERRYFSAAELQQTFLKTWLCTVAFVLIIIAVLRDESLISPNISPQDVKTRGHGRGCVFEVKSGWSKAGDDVH